MVRAGRPATASPPSVPYVIDPLRSLPDRPGIDADGTHRADRAQNHHLSGEPWGVMNGTGSYPGQAWLWLYTLWYQVPPLTTSANAELQLWAIMTGQALGLLPFIPGLRSVARWTKVHRLIRRDHCRAMGSAPPPAAAPQEVMPPKPTRPRASSISPM